MWSERRIMEWDSLAMHYRSTQLYFIAHSCSRWALLLVGKYVGILCVRIGASPVHTKPVMPVPDAAGSTTGFPG